MSKCAEYFDAMENFEMKEEWLKVRATISETRNGC